MSRFMAWIDACIFRDAGDGRTIIFPWGVFGRAYTTASETLKDRIRNLHLFSLMPRHRRHELANVDLDDPAAARRPFDHLLRHDDDLEPLPKRDSAMAFVEKYPKPYILIGLIGCVMFVLLGALMIATGKGEERLAGIFATIVFGAFGAGYGWLLFAKRRIEE